MPKTQAQTFGIEPDSILYVYPPSDEYSYHSIHLPNLTEDTLVMQWRLAEDLMPEGWDYFLCDLGECYSEMPLNETMDPAYGEDIPYLEITLNPNNIIGEGHLSFYVNDKNFPETKQRIEFIFIVGSSATFESKIPALQFFPNPANEILQMKVTSGTIEKLMIYRADGSRFFEQTTPNELIPVSYWPAGGYFIKVLSDNKIYTDKLSIIH